MIKVIIKAVEMCKNFLTPYKTLYYNNKKAKKLQPNNRKTINK